MSVGALKRKRGALKAQLTRLDTFISTYDESKEIQLQQRLTQIRGILDDYINLQIELENADEENAETYIEETEEFETRYFDIIAAADGLLTKNVLPTNNAKVEPKVRLPELSLMRFSGKLEDWPMFFDNFCSLVHDNKTLSNCQRFHYLRAQLSGSAAAAINSLHVTDSNYDIALNILKRRFENKRASVDALLKQIFELKPLQKEDARSMRHLADTFNKVISGLKTRNVDTDNWDAILNYMLTEKLDEVTKRAWMISQTNDKISQFTEFLDFIEKRCILLESLNTKNERMHASFKTSSKPNAVAYSAVTYSSCKLCKEQHFLSHCPKFQEKSVTERKELATKFRLCFNCLGNHKITDCRSKWTCKECKRRHHTLLHAPSNQVDNVNVSDSQDSSAEKAESQQTLGMTAISSNNPKRTTILSTAKVNVIANGKTMTLRCLLDCGAQGNFIVRTACDELNLKIHAVDIDLRGIGNNHENIKQAVNLNIFSLHGNYQRQIECFVLPVLTAKIPPHTIHYDFELPSNVSLADQDFNKSAPIQVILGAEIFWEVLKQGQIQLGHKQPLLQATKLGYVLAGSCNIDNLRKQKIQANCALLDQMRMFWEIEDMQDSQESNEERECEEVFKRTTCMDKSGKFIVEIPLNEKVKSLGETRATALQRFYNTERKLQKNPHLKKQYVQFMDEYETQGHMRKITSEISKKPVFYLPHHGVTKTGTGKHRTVFDGSVNSSTGISLNDIQLKGPIVQNDLFTILIKFRQYTIAINADVEMMYRMIKVCEDQTSLQRILWRKNPEEPLHCYELQTVTYGLKSSPYLATRCLKELGLQNQDTYPEASASIINNFYVDDFLSGASTVEGARQLKEDVTQILHNAGFNLCKWRSNEQTIIRSTANSKDKVMCVKDGTTTKTLGILWDTSEDTLGYVLQEEIKDSPLTKRYLLSNISKIYDPLQILAPILIQGKIIIQNLWKSKTQWDEKVDDAIADEWKKFTSSLEDINSIKIPRCIIPKNVKILQLHGFCDASMHAYAACVYLKTIDVNGCVSTNLVAAKSRVAPLKKLTIPQLELSGALLLATLLNKLQISMDLNEYLVFLWCDSTITLDWIHTSPRKLKVFIANRVTKILKFTKETDWRYVNTKDNPADIATRTNLIQNSEGRMIWLNGPKFIQTSNTDWPVYRAPENDMPETETMGLTTINVTEENYFIRRFSSLPHLLKVTAYCRRFIYNCRNKERRHGSLSTKEYTESLINDVNY